MNRDRIGKIKVMWCYLLKSVPELFLPIKIWNYQRNPKVTLMR